MSVAIRAVKNVFVKIITEFNFKYYKVQINSIVVSPVQVIIFLKMIKSVFKNVAQIYTKIKLIILVQYATIFVRSVLMVK